MITSVRVGTELDCRLSIQSMRIGVGAPTRHRSVELSRELQLQLQPDSPPQAAPADYIATLGAPAAAGKGGMTAAETFLDPFL